MWRLSFQNASQDAPHVFVWEKIQVATLEKFQHTRAVEKGHGINGKKMGKDTRKCCMPFSIALSP